MKKTRYFLIATLVIFTFAGISICNQTTEETEQPACDNYDFPRCTKIYLPVCGTDGKTYANECLLCNVIKQQKVNIRISKRGVC